MLARYKPDRLYISSTFVENIEVDQEQINNLFDICVKKSIKIFVGGAGFDLLDHSHPAVKRRLNNFEDVNTY
jgi:hypothetical protein